jgi:hypothetical protein
MNLSAMMTMQAGMKKRSKAKQDNLGLERIVTPIVPIRLVLFF